MDKYDKPDNRTEKMAARKNTLKCTICRPNRGENAKRRPKYGKTKPKHKTNKRDGLIDHSCKPNCPGCDCE